MFPPTVFVATLLLLLSPITLDYVDGQTSQCATGKNTLVGDVAALSSIQSASPAEAACLAKYDITTKDFCECITNRTSNFVCDFECKCHLDMGDSLFGRCVSSSCKVTAKFFVTLVLAGVTGLVCCVSCCVVCCWACTRRRRRTVVYTAVAPESELDEIPTTTTNV